MKRIDPAREAAIQSTAELIFGWLKQLPSPADGAMALAMAHCAMIWQHQCKDEAQVRQLLGVTVDGIVEMWNQQREQSPETVQ